MKRRLLIVAIFLLAGAVVNVAVAWGCAVWMDPRLREADERTGGEWRAESYRRWIIWERRTAGAVRIWSRWHDRDAGGGGRSGGFPDDPGRPLVPAWAPFLAPDYEPPTAAHHYWIATARGWPLCCLGGAAHLAKRYSDGWKADVEMVWAFALDEGYMADPNLHWEVRLLPCRPLIMPFAVNTLLYATVLWLLIGGPFALRRFIRIKRGLCVKCAYPMAESSVCTECGKALPGRAKAVT